MSGINLTVTIILSLLLGATSDLCANPRETPETATPILTDFVTPTDITPKSKQLAPGKTSNQSLTLRNCLEIIERESWEVLIEREGIQQALQNVYQERARMLPKAEVQYSWNYRQEVSDVSSASDSNVRFQRRGPYDRSNAKVLGVVPIIDINKWYDFDAMKRRYEIAEYTEKIETQLILNASAITFFDFWRAYEESLIIRKSISRAQELETIASNQFDSGVASKIDLIRAQVKISDEQEALISQNTLLSDIALRLKGILNWGLERPLSLTAYNSPRTTLEEDLNWVLAYSYGNRVDLRRAEIEIIKNTAVKNAAVARLYPTLTLYGEYGYGGDDYLPDTTIPEYRALFLVSMPIFDGLEAQARAERARSRIRESEYDLERIQGEIKRQIMISRTNISNLRIQNDIVRRKVDLAEEEYVLAKDRFSTGLASNQESIDALNQLARVEFDLINVHYLQRRAALEYARSRGDVHLLFKEITPLTRKSGQ